MAQLCVSLPATKMRALESFLALESFYLPKMSSILPMRWHSSFLSLGRQTDQWIFDHMGMTDAHPRKKELVQWRIPLFNNMVIPYGDFEKSLLCSKFCWAITALDDPLDDEEEKPEPEIMAYLNSALSIVRGVDDEFVKDTPTLRAWKEVISGMRALMPVPVYQRFQNGLQTWADSLLNLSELSESTYMPHRRSNICYRPWLSMLELCLGVCLEDKDLESQDYVSAEGALIDNIWLVNDLYSTGKDYRNRKVKNMQFILLMTDSAVHNFQQAVNKVCSMVGDKEEEFIFYHDIVVAKAKESGKADLLKYMEGLRGMINSNLVYHNLTARYHGVDNPLVNGDILYGTWNLASPKCTITDRKPEKAQGEYYNLLAL